MLNPFFKNAGPFKIEELLSKINIENKENFKKDKIYNVSDLITANNKDLTFFPIFCISTSDFLFM